MDGLLLSFLLLWSGVVWLVRVWVGKVRGRWVYYLLSIYFQLPHYLLRVSL